MSTDQWAGASGDGLDDAVTQALVRTRRLFTKAEVPQDLRTLHHSGGRESDAFYRDRWAHDKVVRSTHSVNCTGSCSWKGLRQGRHHHLGVATDRLPLSRT